MTPQLEYVISRRVRHKTQANKKLDPVCVLLSHTSPEGIAVRDRQEQLTRLERGEQALHVAAQASPHVQAGETERERCRTLCNDQASPGCNDDSSTSSLPKAGERKNERDVNSSSLILSQHLTLILPEQINERRSSKRKGKHESLFELDIRQRITFHISELVQVLSSAFV